MRATFRGSFLCLLPATAAFVVIAPNSKCSTTVWSSLESGDLKSSAVLSSVPFFAASSSPTQQAGSASATATVTLRLPLGTIFDGRDYVFVTESNVRSYEWTTREADLLMDDLIDAASLGGGGDGGVIEGVGQIIQPVMDYELSQIVVVPTSDWDSNEFGLGNKYDVHDGQQRLVTLNLLLAGLRDIFRREAEDLNARGGLGGKKAVALAATAHEISGMLMPTKVRKSDVLRITLRRRDNVLLERILIGSVDDNDAKADHDIDVDDDIIAGGESSMFTASLPEMAMISYKYHQMSTKDKTSLLSSLSPANSRIFHNFVHLTNRLVSLTTRERLRLLDYIVERVHLLVCIPETSRIARNIVLSQQGRRKGMDNEPIDDFKGLVCFRYTLDEDEMYRTFDCWDILAAEPAKTKEVGTSDDLAASSKTHSVGRDVLTSSCLLRASAALRTKIRSSRDRGGGDEVYEWEKWLRRQLLLKNSQGQTEWQGKDFFVEEIEPSAIALYKFRTGQWDEFNFLSKTSTRKQRDTTVARMNFLRDLMLGAPAKEVEIAVLELLLRIEYGGDSSMLSRYLDEILPLVEKTAFWMALTKPSAMQRHAHVLALLDAMDDFDSVGAKASDDNGIVATSLKDDMDSYDFGSTAAGKKLATAILRRMNAHLMIEEKKTVPEACNDVSTVDLIQQHWTSEEGEGLTHRIGNLALVSSSEARNGRAKKGSGSTWEIKTKRYKKEPWILTRQVADSDQWDVAEVHAQQKDILQLVEYVWS